MKAIVFREFGPPKVLRFEILPDPEPGPGDVVIEVRAVTVNRTLDLVVRTGNYPRQIKLPHVLGADPVGIISAVGRDVTDRRVGQRVATFPLVKAGTADAPPILLGVQHWGGYAERVVVPARITHEIPDGLDFPQAAVVARHASLAFTLLREKAALKVGETVLIMGAAGGLGSAGIQVARHLGAKVIAGAGADERTKIAADLGAHHTINYRREDLAVRVMEMTDGRGADVVFENVGSPNLFPKVVASLARHGRLVTAGAHAGGKVELDLKQLYLRQLTLIGSTMQHPSDTDRSLRLAAEGGLRANFDRIMPLAEAAEAHRLIESGEVTGKIVLVP